MGRVGCIVMNIDIPSLLIGKAMSGGGGGGGATYGLASVSITPEIITVTVTAEEVS